MTFNYYFQNKWATQLAVLTLTLIFTMGSALAQSPEAFNYQAALRDANGQTKPNQPVDFRFTIYSGSGATTKVYEEEHSTTTDGVGLVNLSIGDGNILSGTFSAIDWAGSPHYLKVEVDTGSGYTDMGTMELLSVPYALAAKKVSDMQLSDLDDFPAGTPQAGQVLRYNGSAWVLDSISDSDEQQLSLSGQVLTISNGNSINLPPAKIYGNGAGLVLVNDTFHADTSAAIWNARKLMGHSISGGTPSDSSVLQWNAASNRWEMMKRNEGLWQKSGPTDIYYSNGRVFLPDTSGVFKIDMVVHALGLGLMNTRGPNGNTNVRLTALGNNTDYGYLEINNDTGISRFSALVLPNGEGYAQTNGRNGNLNTQLTTLLNKNDNGFVAVMDSAGGLQAGIYVDASGNGIVFGDQKNFRMPHPTQEGKEIWYGSLEGPELAAYLRGTAKLKNGEVHVSFPEHYQIVANANSMTVSLTPLDASSNGLAVIEKTETGFTVKELSKGTGNYSFDWEVKCVRKGHEDYRVIRDASECQPSKAPAGAAAQME